MRLGITKSLFWTGLAFSSLSLLLFVGLEISSHWEQAKSPGEKNMGVAALFVLFGIPLLISGIAGFLCLLASAAIAVYSRFVPRPPN